MILPVFNYSLTQWNGIAATWVNACSKTSDENYRSLFPVFGLASKFDDAELERMGLCPKICHFLNILSWGYWGYWGFQSRTNACFFRIGHWLTAFFAFANRGKSRFTESPLFHPFYIMHFINFSINFPDLISSSGYPICAKSVPPGSTRVMIFHHFRFLHFFLKFSIMGLHHLNRPLKIRGQVLPSGSAGVMIFWGRSRLRVFAPSSRIKVLPSRQVFDDDSCRRINSAVMKIRLFKPKTFWKTMCRLPSTIRLPLPERQ